MKYLIQVAYNLLTVSAHVTKGSQSTTAGRLRVTLSRNSLKLVIDSLYERAACHFYTGRCNPRRNRQLYQRQQTRLGPSGKGSRAAGTSVSPLRPQQERSCPRRGQLRPRPAVQYQHRGSAAARRPRPSRRLFQPRAVPAFSPQAAAGGRALRQPPPPLSAGAAGRAGRGGAAAAGGGWLGRPRPRARGPLLR